VVGVILKTKSEKETGEVEFLPTEAKLIEKKKEFFL